MHSTTRKERAVRWERERLFFDGDSFFSDVLDAVERAEKSIAIQSYIFERDTLGERIVSALERAAARGVVVQIVVDAIGSPGWAAHYGPRLKKAGIGYRVYHRVSIRRAGKERLPSLRMIASLNWLRRLNHRNHRKLIVVDGTRAWAGSMNISGVHLHEVMHDQAWRDTSLAVEGNPVRELQSAFDCDFLPWRKRIVRRAERRRGSPLIRLNATRRLRKLYYRDLLRRLNHAQTRIWITTPYFVPSGEIIKALRCAAERGVDVRVLVPGRSDVFFMPWVASAFFSALLPGGIRIFEYQPRVLHAKVLQIDDWATVGSSNFNHRSLFHDLEVDIVVSSEPTRQELDAQFVRDLEESSEIKSQSWWPQSLLSRWIGRLMLLFRNWL